MQEHEIIYQCHTANYNKQYLNNKLFILFDNFNITVQGYVLLKPKTHDADVSWFCDTSM